MRNGDARMKRLLFILALVVVVAFSGCTEQGKSPDELKALAVESSENLSSYRLSSSVDQTIELKGGDNASNAANITTISERLSTESAVDLVGFKAWVQGLRENSLELPGQPANVSSTQAIVYQMGNSTYLQEDNGNWTHLVDPTPVEEIWGEGQNNQIKALAERINESPLEMVGSEKVGDVDSYKLKVITGESDYANLYNSAFSVAIMLVQYPMFIPSINRTELNESSQIEKYVWMAKDSGLPVKYQSIIDFSMTPVIVGGLDPNNGQMMMFNESLSLGEVSVRIESTDLYTDINKPVDIVLPEDASKAEAIHPSALQSSLV
jgi:hypothetical protein